MLLATALLVSLQAGGLTATVSDSGSHGSLGDSLLSLDEAIQIANGTLSLGVLSPSERQSIGGNGNDIETIVIDASVTPTITYQAEVSELRSPLVRVTIEGLDHQGARPVLDIGSFSAGLKLRTPSVDVRNLSFRNGRAAIDIETLSGAPGNAAGLFNLDVDGQSEVGLRIHAAAVPAGQFTAVEIERSSFRNLPVGYEIVDQSRNGGISCVSDNVYMFGAAIGAEVVSDAFGGTSGLEFWRSDFGNGERFVRFRRTAASTQRQELRVV